jgi:type VI secretion system protein ImpB
MAKESSIAPKERVNIVYKSATGDQQEEVELPLKILMMGNYTGREDTTPLEERAPVNVDKDNFNQVMSQQELKVDLSVNNKLEGDGKDSLPVKLEFKTLADFNPEGVVNQVPELKKLLELRNALAALKGPLGNTPAFRKKIQQLLGDETQRTKLMAELGMKNE